MSDNAQAGEFSCSRRRLLSGAAGLAAGLLGSTAAADQKQPWLSEPAATRGRIRQSVCAWCFAKHFSDEQLAQHARRLGIQSIELIEPAKWPILKKHGLVCALTSSHGFVEGWNNPQNHAMCETKVREAIDCTSAAGFPNVITFSGFRKGIPDDVGLENTIRGLKKVVGQAEKKKVTLILEMLNSRVDVEMKGHPDYMADKIEWAVEVCRRIGSPRMKILFDVYHVQIMQGDVMARIRQFHPYIGHYHVAGVPGRNEPDESQEINYPPILREIVKTGYRGYLAQEFIPTRDPLRSLWEAVKLCDV